MQAVSNIGDRIRALRLARKEDQVDVAVAVGVARPTVTEWETGRKKPRREKLQAMARHFNVTTDFLLWGDRPRSEIKPASPEEERMLLLSRRVSDGVLSAVLTLLESSADADPADDPAGGGGVSKTKK